MQANTFIDTSLEAREVLNNITIGSGAPPDDMNVTYPTSFDNNLGGWEDDDDDSNPPDISHEGGEYTDIIQNFLENFEPE